MMQDHVCSVNVSQEIADFVSILALLHFLEMGQLVFHLLQE